MVDKISNVTACQLGIPSIIHVGIDFNISPISCIVLAGHGSQSLWAIDEIVLYNSNTLDSYTDFGLYLSYDIASSSCSMPINNSF